MENTTEIKTKITVKSSVQKAIRFTFERVEGSPLGSRMVVVSKYGNNPHAFSITVEHDIKHCRVSIYRVGSSVVWIGSTAYDLTEADARRIAAEFALEVDEATAP